MDTKTLVVGQEVYMFCGSEFYGFEKGKVVKITSAGVEVLVGESIIRFDNNGTELEVERRKRHGFEPEPGFSHDRFMQSIWYTAPECGPWRLDDMPFEERTAKIEHHQRLLKIIKTLVVGQDVYMVSGVYGCKGKVVKITPSGVEVQITEHESTPYPLDGRAQGRSEDDPVDWDSWNAIAHGSSGLSPVLRFNKDGKGCDGNETFECGPWYIDAMPFAERKAMLEIDYRENLRKIREVCPNYNTDQPQQVRQNRCNRQE